MTMILEWTLAQNQENSTTYEFHRYTHIKSTPEDVALIDDIVLRLKSTDRLVSNAILYDVNPEHNGVVLTCANTMLLEK